jgi:enamine deaminase RidA (YjgF/YER057c/UK114 family)
MKRTLVSSGSSYEPIIGFSRAVRVGNHVSVSGTAPVAPDGSVAAPGDAAGQARRIFEIVAAALDGAGASLKHVVRTHVMLRHIDDWKAVAQVHGEIFSEIRPATCFVEVSRLIDPDWLVEIEVDAVVDDGKE